MKTSQEIRFKNLLALCDRFKSRSDFARHIGKPVAIVSHWFIAESSNGGRAIGHAAARLVEEKMGLPRGWLDNDHEALDQPPTPAAPRAGAPAEAPLTTTERELVRLFRRVSPETQAATLGMLRAATRAQKKG